MSRFGQLLVSLLVTLQLTRICHLQQVPDPLEYCQWETFNATCDPDEVVLMTHAQYGRMRLGRCLTTDVYIGCGGDVLPQIDLKCSGRQTCQISLPDPTLHTSPCPGDLVGYLEASFICTKVATLADGQCRGDRDPPILKNGSGMLSSNAALRSGYGLPGCPWIVEVSSGQKVKVTLYDFSLASRYRTESWYALDGEREYCYVYAVIRERNGDKEFTVCAGSQRENVVYLSSTNVIEIVLLDVDKENAQNFLFRYEAVGCADMAPPENGYVIRQADGATISCNGSSQAWHLVCKDTEWIGEYGDCSPGAAISSTPQEGSLPSYGLILAVLIGVAIGIVVGFTLLATVLWCRRRRRYKRPAQQEPDPGLTTLQMSPSNPGSPHCKVHRLKAEYGYTHVWEVQASPGRTKPRQTTLTPADSAYQSYHRQRGVPGSRDALFCLHSKKEHEYESPKFETFGIGIGRDVKFHQGAFYQGYDRTVPRPGQCADSLDSVVQIEVGLDSAPGCGPASSGAQLPAAGHPPAAGQLSTGYSVAGDAKAPISDVTEGTFDSCADPKGNHYT